VKSRAGGMPITRPPEATKKAGVYKASYPIKPGETRFDVGYTLPPGDAFSGENLILRRPVITWSHRRQVRHRRRHRGQRQEPQPMRTSYVTSRVLSVTIGGTGDFRRSRPAPKTPDRTGSVQPPRVYNRLYWVLGLTLAILAIGRYGALWKGAA